MKKFRTMGTIALSTMLLLTSCGGSGDEATETSSTSLKVFGWQPFGNGDTPEDELEKEAGIQWAKDYAGVDAYFNFPADDYDNQLASTLSSGEKYDLIYFQQGDYQNFVEQGALTDLSPYIEASPILSDPTILPDTYLDTLRQPDGGIYAIPTKFDGGLVATVRQDWLDEFGIDKPETLDDWENYWALAKEKKGAVGLSTRVLYDIQPWASGFGLTYGIQQNDDGTLTVPYASDEAADMWAWFNDMYVKGYFDPNFETNASSDFRNKFMAGQAASVCYWQHWIGTFDQKVAYDETNTQRDTFDAVAVPPVLKDGEGAVTYGELSLLGIPANAEHPENAIKYLEAWYSEAGNLAGTVGYEGIDYNLDENGEIVMTDTGIEHSFNHSGSEPVNTNWVYPESVGGDPRDEDELEALDILNEYGVSAYYPSNNADILTVVDKYGSMAIKGSISPEEAVETMQEEIIALGEQAGQTFVFD